MGEGNEIRVQEAPKNRPPVRKGRIVRQKAQVYSFPKSGGAGFLLGCGFGENDRERIFLGNSIPPLNLPPVTLGPKQKLDDAKKLEKAFADSSTLFDEKYFLKNIGSESEPIYLVQSRTQGLQVVSEGFGYVMSRIVNHAMRFKTKKFQKIYNGLQRGLMLTLNRNGLPAWRSYAYEKEFDPKNQADNGKVIVAIMPHISGKLHEMGIRFKSKYDTYSAVDADLKVAAASAGADALTQQRIWDPSPQFNLPASLFRHYEDKTGWAKRDFPKKVGYREFTRLMAEGIKNFDVEKKGERYILKVSDMWGGGDSRFPGGDVKGTVTANDSYSLFSELYYLAKVFPEEKEFFLQVRKDSFDRLKAVYQFGQQMFGRILTSKRVNGYVTLEREERQLFVNLVAKLSPFELGGDPEMPLKKEWNRTNGLIYINEHVTLDPEKTVIYQDGSWDVPRDLFDSLIKKIQQKKLHHFFPDQTEVEVLPDGKTFNVRMEIGAGNLDFTEGLDGIRVYAELGKDLIYHNDSSDKDILPEYQISSEEFALLQRVMKGARENPNEARAGRWHNPAAVSCYMLAAAGLKRYDSGYSALFNRYVDKLVKMDLFNRKENMDIEDYYNAALSLKNISELMAADSEIYPYSHAKIAKYDKVPRKSEMPGIKYYHEDIDYAVRALELDFKFGNRKQTYSREMARKGLLTALEEAKNSKDPIKLQNLVDKYMEYGAYHAALDQTFELLRDAKSPKTSGLNEESFKNSVSTFVDISGLFQESSEQISDTLRWLSDRRYSNLEGKNSLRHLSLALLDQYIFQRRMAFSEELAGTISLPPFTFRNYTDPNRSKDRENRLIVPLPYQESAARLLANYIKTLSLGYRIEPFNPSGTTSPYKERKYNYGQALAALKYAIGKDDPIFGIIEAPARASLHREPKWEIREGILTEAQKKRIDELKAGMVESLNSRLVFAYAETIQQMAYDQKDSMDNRLYYSSAWKEDWHNNKYKTVGEFAQIVENNNRAIEVYKEAMTREMEGAKGIQDPKFLGKIFDALLSAYNFKMVITGEKTEEAGKVYTAYRNARNPITRADIKNIWAGGMSEIKGALREVEEISSVFISKFASPLWEVRVKILKPAGLFKRALDAMVASQEMRSPDPRNISFMNWTRKFSESFAIAGIKAQDPGYFDKSFDFTAVVSDPKIYVGNKRLKALFLVQAAVKMADSIFAFRQLNKLRQETPRQKAVVDQQRKDLEILFGALLELDGKPTGAVPSSPVIRKIYNYILENREAIKEVYLDDDTQRAKIYTKHANLIWWGEEAEDSATIAIRAKAIEEYEKALAIDPFDPATLLGAAEVSMLQNDLDGASRYFVEALRSMGRGKIEEYMRKKIPDLAGKINTKLTERYKVFGRGELLDPRMKTAFSRARGYLSEKELGEVNQGHIDYLNQLFIGF